MQDRFIAAYLLLVGLAAITLFVVSFMTLAAQTGPYCPGKDPAWLGYCDAAPEVQP